MQRKKFLIEQSLSDGRERQLPEVNEQHPALLPLGDTGQLPVITKIRTNKENHKNCFQVRPGEKGKSDHPEDKKSLGVVPLK